MAISAKQFMSVLSPEMFPTHLLGCCCCSGLDEADEADNLCEVSDEAGLSDVEMCRLLGFSCGIM